MERGTDHTFRSKRDFFSKGISCPIYRLESVLQVSMLSTVAYRIAIASLSGSDTASNAKSSLLYTLMSCPIPCA